MRVVIIALMSLMSSVSFAHEIPNRVYHQGEHQCMALNIYFEARGSSIADQAAVADVVLNRVLDSRYPDTVCEVITQGGTARNKCQFSWFCDGKSDQPKDMVSWKQSELIAYQIMYFNRFRGITEGSTHYHATYVNPKWSSSLIQTGRIGEHIFYRWN